MACLGHRPRLTELRQRQRWLEVRRPRFAGAGGFINISQNASRLRFVSPAPSPPAVFEVVIEDGRLRIVVTPEGRTPQVRTKPSSRSPFSETSLPPRPSKPVLYVTERCVFTARFKEACS